jgi:hypothetical protein
MPRARAPIETSERDGPRTGGQALTDGLCAAMLIFAVARSRSPALFTRLCALEAPGFSRGEVYRPAALVRLTRKRSRLRW